MATPPRKPSALRARRKAQNGRFWIGKSPAGAFAEPTQLPSAGSWVASIAFRDTDAVRFGSGATPPGRRRCRRVRREVLLQAPPRLRVVALQERGLERVARRTDHGARLEHEGHGVGDV